ncbi:MAG TPA: hypothetical protein VF101_12305 [Gaiellaceae bacterium]
MARVFGLLVLAATAVACTSQKAAPRSPTTGPAVPGFHRIACPAGGRTREVFASPRLPRRREIADYESSSGLLGWKIVRGADVLLPSGRLLVTGGEYLGADSKPADLGVKPGRYPWFLILARYKRFDEPIFAQLVLDPARRPVRWADDRRFGWLTDGGVGFIGSPESARTLSIRNTNWDRMTAGLEKSPCVAYADARGRNFVVYRNGFGDGGFPGTAGFDGRGRLVAVTWLLGPEPWVLGGLPGTPPAWVRKIIACRRRLIARGVSRAASMRRCGKFASS